MTADQIWVSANCYRETIRAIYHALCEGKDINDGMNGLKQNIPTLYGVDFEKKGFVFQSTDNGLVAIYVNELGGDFVLVMTANVHLT